MIASVHIADVGFPALAVLVKNLRGGDVPGLRYGDVMTVARLGGSLLTAPRPTRVGLVAAWEDEAALERFLGEHPLAKRLAGGWHVRLKPVRASGAWTELPELAGVGEHMDEQEPVAVLTLGRLRLGRVVPFFRTNQPAADLAAANPSVLAMTALARPPKVVATFSLWRTVTAMRDYAYGAADQSHRNAIRAQEARSFHHEATFIRFRPYASSGQWDGRDPLAIA
jgi:hypothetical protein